MTPYQKVIESKFVALEVFASLQPSRIGRNPKTGEPVSLSEKYVPHFKPGKDLKQKVNESREHSIQIQSSQ